MEETSALCSGDSSRTMTSRVSAEVNNDDDGDGRYNPSNSGPIKNRGCTDVVCLLLLLAFLAGWLVVGLYAFSRGNPAQLVYPSDSNGRICGRGDNAGRPHLFFFDITKCARPSSVALGCPTKQVCVEKCPDKAKSPWFEAKAGSALTDSALKAEMKPYCDHTKFTDTLTAKELIEKSICPDWYVQSGPVVGRCIPFFNVYNNSVDTVIFEENEMSPSMDGDFTVAKLEKFVEKLAAVLQFKSVGEKVISDIAESWWAILMGVILATFVAFIWIIAMRFLAGLMVWTSVILSVALLAACCIYSGMKFAATYRSPDSPAERDLLADINASLEHPMTWLVFMAASGIVLLVVLMLLCFLRSRIRIAIELIEEGSVAIGHMVSTLVFPIVPFAMEVVFVAWFLLVAAFLQSSGQKEFHIHLVGASCTVNGSKLEDGGSCDSEQQTFQCAEPESTATCQFLRYGPSVETVYLHVYNLFGFFWGICFISAMGQMVLAGAFASWYWVMDKRDVPRLPLMSSFYRTFRFHLGTLAFGALIIAIIKMIRVILDHIEKTLKEYNQDNPVVKCVMCCCKCCFYCLEKFMKFINKNAYIMTAIYGKSFCWSAKEAFSLLMRNIARVFVLDKVTDFLLLLGKLVIVGGIATGSFFVFGGRINELNNTIPDLNFVAVPITIVTLAAYFIADMFFGVYEMAVDTLFLCFLLDSEKNDGSQSKPYFMSKNLRKILGKKNHSADK